MWRKYLTNEKCSWEFKRRLTMVLDAWRLLIILMRAGPMCCGWNLHKMMFMICVFDLTSVLCPILFPALYLCCKDIVSNILCQLASDQVDSMGDPGSWRRKGKDKDSIPSRTCLSSIVMAINGQSLLSGPSSFWTGLLSIWPPRSMETVSPSLVSLILWQVVAFHYS